MTDYVHGYGTPEQDRLVEQAEHWRHRLIRDGTELEPGTRLLEVGCGVGAVLAVLGQEYPGVELFGVDIEQKQLDFARGHLERAGVEATLRQADALALPFTDGSFDHVWMMWFLEHLADPPWSDAGTRLPGWLQEARFRAVDEGERTFWWQDEDLSGQARYAADVMESALPALAQLSGADQEELRAGLGDLRNLASQPNAGLGWVVHKSTATR